MPITKRPFGSSNVHYLSSEHRGFGFDKSVPAALTVESGDIVVFQCREAYDGQVTRNATLQEVEELDSARLHAVTGPVEVVGAEPGGHPDGRNPRVRA
jgi:acetamidase/formamidase